DGKSTVTLSGTISNNYGKQNGGGIHLTGGSTCHLSGTQIVCNQTNFSSAATFGGGVYVVSGTLNLVKSTRQTLFEGNEAGCGGGIQFHNNGKLTCESGSSVKFLNNTAKSSGGAIRFYSKYDIDMDGFEFESNSANFGGAILINTAKYNGAVTINNSTFTENEAGESGGAIYMDSASYQSGIVAGDLTINGCSFSGNTAETSGTALYCNKQNTTLSGNTTISATTSQTVSLIHVSNTGKATFDSVLIDGNSTNAIAVDVHGASGTDNIAFGTGLEIRNFNGSAVKIAGGTQTLSYGYMHNNGIDLDISASANVTIGTESVSDSALSVKQDANGGSIVVSGATLTVNNLGSETSLDYGSAQEAFSSYSSTSFVKATNSATVNYNDSSRLVLPIYINASTLKFNGISESGIYLTNGSSCEYNGTINDEWDFGLLELNNSECTMMGGSITSDRGYIGVNLANNSTFTIAETATNAVIKKCAEGGIVSDGTSTIKLYNGKISDCGTKDNYLYGGIYSFGTVDVLGNVEISNCYAENGAGILVKNGTLNISAGVIKSNTASVYGGGIAVINGKLNMTGGEVSGNTAGSSDSGGGGGIYVSGTTANIKDSIIGGNTSNFHGGGIYSVSSTILTIESSIVGSDESKNIAGNTAVDTGGGIYHNNKKQLTLKGVNIQGNNAKNGGGIAIRSSGAMAFETLSDGTKNVITENEASQYGGGLFLRSSSNVELNENVEINENIAKFGGGIYVHTNNVLLTIDGAAINQNNAMTSGGGIYSSVANVTMNSGTISENSSVSQGGGIHILGESSDISATVLQLNGGAISENRADTGGGIYTKNATVNIGSIDDVSEILVGSNVGFTGGGGIYLGELSVLNMWGSEDVENSDPLYGFVSNKVDGYDSDGNFVARSEFFGRGAGVYIRNNSTFNMYSGYVAYNTIGSNVNRPIGAGMYIGANSTANLSGGTFLENVVQASTSHGVEIAVHQNNSALNISENARIIATSVEKHAIYNHGTLGIENGTFENVSVFNAGVATIAYTQSALS
ncbi:MAG: hypothetical protein IJW24_03585, partial [Clostridia bacterium]|nr:hypothetical protein [Clostridia bacterium]